MAMPKTWHRLDYGKCHLISEIQDGETFVIVYKYWRPARQRWEYVAETKESHGYATKVGLTKQ